MGPVAALFLLSYPHVALLEVVSSLLNLISLDSPEVQSRLIVKIKVLRHAPQRETPVTTIF